MRWTTITSDHLKSLGHGSIVDRARAIAVGALDPVSEAIADATARVRRAVSTGNVLDADPTTVPDSLKLVAIRLSLFALMERIGLPLSEDQRQTRRDDISDLNRITDNRTKVELPDNPDSSAEMQATGHAIEALNVHNRQTRRKDLNGL